MAQVQLTTSGVESVTFSGAYNARMMERKMRRTSEAPEPAPKQPVKEVYSEDYKVTVSPEAQAFLTDGASEHRAQLPYAAEAEEAKKISSEDPFEATGDTSRQYLVFSEHLYNAGFYDGMSDDEVKQTEGLLRDITSSMDLISPNSITASSAASPSAAAAQIAYASSVEALNQFADSYLSGELQSSFRDLVMSYAAHNEPIVNTHHNAVDRQDQMLATFSGTRFYKADTPTTPDPAKAAAARLGKIRLSAEKNMKMRDATFSFFRDVRAGHMSVNAAINKLKGSFLSYASDNHQDGDMRSLLIKRNSAVFRQVSAYWGILMQSA